MRRLRLHSHYLNHPHSSCSLIRYKGSSIAEVAIENYVYGPWSDVSDAKGKAGRRSFRSFMSGPVDPLRAQAEPSTTYYGGTAPAGNTARKSEHSSQIRTNALQLSVN